MYPNKISDGIDASIYQGNINWQIYKSRYDFVLLKCSTTTSVGAMATAENFVKNFKGAKEAGVKNIGVYHFSNATTVELAKMEAKVTLKALGEVQASPSDLSMQIWYDIESKTMKPLGREKLEEIFLAYKKEMNNAGYKVGIYTNKDWLTNVWDANFFKSRGCPIWMAQYNSSMTYRDPKVVDIWQKSSIYKDTAVCNEDMDYNILYTPIAELFKGQNVNLSATELPGRVVWEKIVTGSGNKWKAYVNGKQVFGNFVSDEKGRYYIGASGYMLDNAWLKMDNERWIFAKPGGYLANSETIEISGHSYYFGEDYYMGTGYHIFGNKWYYFVPQGVIISDPNHAGGSYPEGAMLRSGIYTVKGKQLYFDEKGQVVTGKTIKASADAEGYLTYTV